MKKNQLAIMTSLLIMCACTGEKKAETTEAVVEELPKVKIALVQTRPVKQWQEFTATVEADVKNNIAPSTPVRIEKIFVEIGDNVRKGQKLVQMDAANLKQLKTQMENQQIEFNRVDELYKVGGASKSEWDSKKMSLDVMQTSYKNLLENTTLVSPIDGVITARNYDNGDMFGSGKPVLTVEQITPVKLMVNVSEAYYTKVKKGMNVAIKLDVYGDEEFAGKISLIYPTIDPVTRTFSVEIEMANQDKRIRPGMFARAILDFGILDRVVVPDLSVVKRAGTGDRYIYVYKDGKVSYNKVELGKRIDTEYELISGVENNSQVVVGGQSRLADGVAVEIDK